VAARTRSWIVGLALPMVVAIGLIAVSPWVGIPAVAAIVAGAAAMTRFAVSKDATERAAMDAALVRAKAIGEWGGAVSATLIDGDTWTRGFLALHDDRIGFFPLASADDLVIPRPAIISIEAIPHPAHVNQLLRIQWLGERIETRVFAAGSNLSPWTGESSSTELAPLPRATAKIRDEQ